MQLPPRLCNHQPPPTSSFPGTADLLTNKFPLFANHMLLVAKSLVPQQMTATQSGPAAI